MCFGSKHHNIDIFKRPQNKMYPKFKLKSNKLTIKLYEILAKVQNIYPKMKKIIIKIYKEKNIKNYFNIFYIKKLELLKKLAEHILNLNYYNII